jgi:hypothetical protein
MSTPFQMLVIALDNLLSVNPGQDHQNNRCTTFTSSWNRSHQAVARAHDQHTYRCRPETAARWSRSSVGRVVLGKWNRLEFTASSTFVESQGAHSSERRWLLLFSIRSPTEIRGQIVHHLVELLRLAANKLCRSCHAQAAKPGFEWDVHALRNRRSGLD